MWEELKNDGVDIEFIEQEVAREPPSGLDMGANESPSKFLLRQKIFQALSTDVQFARISLMGDAFDSLDSAVWEDRNHPKRRELVLQLQRLLEWSPLTPNFLTDPSKGLHTYLAALTSQVVLMRMHQAQQANEEQDADGVPPNLEGLDGTSDDSELYDSDSEQETLGQTLRRVGGRGKKNHGKGGMSTQRALIVGGVVAALVSVFSAFALGYVINRKRN
jgi:hypothetical protein